MSLLAEMIMNNNMAKFTSPPKNNAERNERSKVNHNTAKASIFNY